MRLTNEFREQLIGAAMARAFKDRDEAHRVATVALGDALYADTHGAAEKAARKLPQGWVQHGTSIKIEAAGFWTPGAGTGRKSSVLPMSRARPFPFHGADRPVSVGARHPLNEQAQDLAQQHAQLRDDKADLHAKLHGLVYSVRTLVQLLEAWPECADILPASAPRPSRAVVPIDLVSTINKLVRLTSEGSKNAKA